MPPLEKNRRRLSTLSLCGLSISAVTASPHPLNPKLSTDNLQLPMKPILRLANRSDIPQIMGVTSRAVAILNAAGNFQWDSTYPNPTVFGEDIANGHLWLAEDEATGRVLAFIAMTLTQPEEYAGVGWRMEEPSMVLHRLAVDPAVRGGGLARLLLLKSEEEARRQGLPRIRVDTGALNKAMQSLLASLGYAYAGDIHLKECGEIVFQCWEKVV